jgi:hypothetical protein
MEEETTETIETIETIEPEKIDGRSKPRTEKQKLQFLKLQEIRQARAIKSRMEKNEKIKEMILKQIEIEKRNKSVNNRKIKKISNSILDDEFKQDDKEVLKNILNQERQKKEKEKEKPHEKIDYRKLF